MHMLDGADVTDVDDREAIVQLAAYWPLGFLPSWFEGGEESSFGVVIRIAIWKMSDGANAMVRLYILWL